MEPELVVQPQDGRLNLLLWDLYHRAIVLIPVVIPANPVQFGAAPCPLEKRPAGATDDFPSQWIVQMLFSGDLFRPAIQECPHSLKSISVNNGRVTAWEIILLLFSMVDFF